MKLPENKWWRAAAMLVQEADMVRDPGYPFLVGIATPSLAESEDISKGGLISAR